MKVKQQLVHLTLDLPFISVRIIVGVGDLTPGFSTLRF